MGQRRKIGQRHRALRKCPERACAPGPSLERDLIEANEVIRRIWLAFETRSLLPTQHVAFADGSVPEAHRCEQNVLRWTAENTGNEPVHGWLATGLLLQKHWMVRDRTGAVFNITPVAPATPMFLHPGPVEEFRQLLEEIHLVMHQHLRPAPT